MKDRAYEIVITRKYDGHQRGLASTVYKFFDKKIGSGIGANADFHKSVTKKTQKKKSLCEI